MMKVGAALNSVFSTVEEKVIASEKLMTALGVTHDMLPSQQEAQATVTPCRAVTRRAPFVIPATAIETPVEYDKHVFYCDPKDLQVCVCMSTASTNKLKANRIVNAALNQVGTLEHQALTIHDIVGLQH